ncbi:MAG: GPR endopeptidase, partial [Clostridia bacterium]|nr:GPR endopeptidase [Clostridia bacterium]
ILEYKYNREKLLFVGLGNAKYISDALGELVLDNLPEPHKKMAKFKPQVSKLTGIQSHDLIIAAKKIIKPTLIIAIDSLATSDISKVGKSIQITNVGLAPASGLGIARQVLTAKNLGVPILAIGVPLVANVNIKGSNRLVIPIDIEDIAQNLAKAIANGITQILN